MRASLSRLVVTGAVGLASFGLTAAPAGAAPTCLTASGVTTCTYLFTGSEESFVVPPGVTSVDVVLVGGAGGSGSGSSGGLGAKVTATVAVVPGTTLYVRVGGLGENATSSASIMAGGYNGGGSGRDIRTLQAGAGGGGASDIRTTAGDTSTRLVVAGGGGGGLRNCSLGQTCAGGTGNSGANGEGGAGSSSGTCAGNGGGGTASQGGAGQQPTLSGTFALGGEGSDNGGGGGGGWYGGGGGLACGSGGAGSSYAAASASNVQFLPADADARVSIGYTVPVPCSSGRYSASGFNPCTDASPGHFVHGTGATLQAACVLGSYQPSAGATNCLSADRGFYVDTTGSATQTPCPPGTTTAGIHSTSAAACFSPSFQLTVTVHDANGTHPVVLDVDDNDTILQVKQKLEDVDGLSQACQRMELPGIGVLADGSTLDSYGIDSHSSVHVYNTCNVTSAGLCALTKDFVRMSSNYVNAKPLVKKAVDLLVGVTCKVLTDIGPRVKPAQKAKFIDTYKKGVQGLVQPGWLTQQQANTLKALADGL